MRLLTISSEGGTPQELIPEHSGGIVGAHMWAPDGKSIVFGHWTAKEKAIFSLDLRTRQATKLPGSEDMYAARFIRISRCCTIFVQRGGQSWPREISGLIAGP
jgi:hypothetical protein